MGRTKRTSQTTALRAFELGSPLNPSLTFRSELTLLTHYHRPEKPFASQFRPHPTTSVLRNAYVTDIAASPDRALCAIASTDGRVELHEPAAADSLRMTLERVNAESRLSTLTFFPENGNAKSDDALLTCASESAAAYFYDLNVCRVDRPTQSLYFRNDPRRTITGIAPSTRPIFVAVRPSGVSVFDLRLPHGGEAFAASIPCKDPVAATRDDFIFIAEGDQILTYDRRQLPAAKMMRTSLSLTMGRAADNSVSSVSVPLPKHARYNWLVAPPQAPPGFYAFHATDGTFGTVDLVSRAVEKVKETEAEEKTFLELAQYGTMEASFTQNAWYIRRRRGDIITGPYSRGWRVIVPNMLSTGARTIAFGPDLPMQEYSIPAAQQMDVSSIHAVDGKFDKLLLGTSRNEVDSLEIDMDRTWKESMKEGSNN